MGAEILEYNESIESLGMGGVRILRKNNPASMLLNPGTLAWNEGMSWDIANIGTGLNTSALTDASSFQNISASNMNALYGKPISVRANGHTSLSFPYFGFSVYNQSNLGLVINNPAYPNATLDLSNDYAYLIGTGFPLGPFVSAGANFKRITRLGGRFELGPNDLATISNSNLQNNLQNEGTGYGVDLGLIVQIPGGLNPTFHASWKDVGSTAFIRSKGTSTPTSIQDNLSFGAQVSAEAFGTGFAAGLEYRNVNLSSEQLGKKIHLGVELELGPAVARAGFYQGYTSYGASIQLSIVELHAALYSVETGVFPGQTASQRAQAGFVLGISLNPDFKLLDTSSAGARRKLKQRR